jgi:hypothetical protein
MQAFLIPALTVVLPACWGLPTHEDFRLHMDDSIGKSVDDPRTRWARPDALVDSRPLANGNVENQYRWQRNCRYFFEIDPETRIIQAWRFEGRRMDCAVAR